MISDIEGGIAGVGIKIHGIIGKINNKRNCQYLSSLILDSSLNIKSSRRNGRFKHLKVKDWAWSSGKAWDSYIEDYLWDLKSWCVEHRFTWKLVKSFEIQDGTKKVVLLRSILLLSLPRYHKKSHWITKARSLKFSME